MDLNHFKDLYGVYCDLLWPQVKKDLTKMSGASKQQRRGRKGGKNENSKILQNQQHEKLVQGQIKQSFLRDFHIINTQTYC